MKLLTLESTNKICSVAIKNNKQINFLYKFSYNNHSQIIMSIINKILLKTSISLKEIDYIAVSIGPGSFTGIRISINIAHGFSTGLNIPLIGISTLKILAEQAKRKTLYKNFIIVIQANKKKIYWGKYFFNNKKWNLKKKELYISYKSALKKIQKTKKKWKIIGNLNSYILKKINLNQFIPNINYPKALDMIPLALKDIKNKKKIQKIILPNYLNNKFI
ncbi:tRNA (adenosine(37)-N6)-threonylcarbamoyltransferase complex dimerization subunit type 1 TsaB [Buchnera aphidicola]|uniref:tRNA (adenosine(37)-N6)-threonylcarbamoyltransferase complex dimerization subunit type 1 TsaB n=1 Tax=Buchnera aphidicola TaxID=9 RepID=UPI003464C5EE